MYRSTRGGALLGSGGGGTATRVIGRASQDRGLFVHSVNGRRVAYKVYFYDFEGSAYFRQLVTRRGGQIVSRADIATADVAISTVYVHDGARMAPLCTPQFLIDSAQAGSLKDATEYLVEYPVAQSSQPATQTSAVSSDDEDDDDDVIQDVRRLYEDEVLDAEDRLVNSLLASQSRNISEYAGLEPGSPGASSTNSVDISDSDYRTKRVLDRASRSFTEAPLASSPLAMRWTPGQSASPAPALKPPQSGPRAARTTQRSPSFIAARTFFEPLRSSSDTLPMATNAAAMGPTRTPRRAASSTAAKAELAHDRLAVLDPAPEIVVAASPELEMPLSQTPVGLNFTFIQSQGDMVVTPLSARAMQPRAATPRAGHNDSRSDRGTIELVHTLSDEEYPDPTAFLAPRASNSNSNGSLQDVGAVQDADEPAMQDLDALVDDSSELFDDEPPRTPVSARVQAEAETAPWTGQKRRRGSPSKSGYGEQPVPVVVRSHSTLSPSSAPLGTQHAPSLQLVFPPSQEVPESGLVATLRSQSLDSIATPARRHQPAQPQNWSASKRIRMSGSSSPDDDGGNGAGERGSPPPSDSMAVASTAPVTDKPMSSPVPAGAPNQAAQPQVCAVATVVLADESSSYPTTNSSAPQVSSLDAATHTPYVSQTPDELSPDHGLLGRGSSQITEPVPGEWSDEEPSENYGGSDDEGSEASEVEREDAVEAEVEASHGGNDSSAAPALDDSAVSSALGVGPDVAAGPDTGVFDIVDDDDDTVCGNTASAAQATPQGRRSRQGISATEVRPQRTSAHAVESRRRTLDVLGRQRRGSTSRHITVCQRLLELNKLTMSDGGLGIQLDPALAPPTRLVGGELPNRAHTAAVPPSPSTPSRPAAFSGAMRVLGEGEPLVTDIDRLRHMCKLKGLIADTTLSAKEALQILYLFTGDWVSARRYIVFGEESLDEDCMWSPEEDEVLRQGVDSAKIADLFQRKGNVEVFRRQQFLNTYFSPRVQ